MAILNHLSLPFEGNFPITFAFGALPDSTEIQEKYRSWGLQGHNGIDYGLPKGTPVYSCDEGTILQAGDNGDFGTSVTIQHSWGTSLCAHLSSLEIQPGQQVSKHQRLGNSGDSGFTSGPHLHFAIKPTETDINNGFLGYVDPAPYFQTVTTSPTVIEKEVIKEVVKEVPVEVIREVIKEVPAQSEWKAVQPLGNKFKKERKQQLLQAIVAFVRASQHVSSKQIQAKFTLPQSTVTDYLQELVKTNQLKRVGKTRASKYYT